MPSRRPLANAEPQHSGEPCDDTFEVEPAVEQDWLLVSRSTTEPQSVANDQVDDGGNSNLVQVHGADTGRASYPVGSVNFKPTVAGSEDYGRNRDLDAIARPSSAISGRIEGEALRLAASEMDHERKQYNQRCRLVESTLQRILHAFETDPLPIETIEELRRQLIDNNALVIQQSIVIKESESVFLRLVDAAISQAEVGEDRPPGQFSDSKLTEPDAHATQGLVHAEPLVERYIRRAGDASIAMERIAELDHHAAVRFLQRDSPQHPPQLVALTDQSEGLRRASLERELHCALRDAEVLKAECIAQGHDVRVARRRRRSTGLSQRNTSA